MTYFIVACLLLVLAIAGVVIRKTYYRLPVRELKRRAEKQDEISLKLYRAVAYGDSLRGLLWIFITVTSAAGFVLLAKVAPVWLSLVIVVGIMWIAFSWLPASRVSSFGTRLTLMVTPAVNWILNRIFPALERSTSVVSKRYTADLHTSLYERSDLLRLIDQQQKQHDSRLSQEELEIVKHVLSFSDRQVGDILTPRKMIKTLLASDTVGPVLINELYEHGEDIILVRDSPRGPIIGLLERSRLDIKSKGQVRDVMNQTVYYVHEHDNLSEALHAFFTTNHPLFVVVNNTEEYVGVVSVRDIIHTLLGHIPGDDFDQYSDLTAVASRHRRHKQPESSDSGEEVAINPEEVVE
jgi:CBS domain containing-hemolysin-like protein